MPRNLIVGSFGTEEGLLAATRAARGRGLAIYDTFTPFAVHGMDEAMGLERPPLAKVCFVAGLMGLVVALGFQLWASARDWPLNVGGKSFTALPALIPITFEVVILFAATATVGALALLGRLWPGRESGALAPGATDDRFVLVLEEAGPEQGGARDFLVEQGAAGVRVVEARP